MTTVSALSSSEGAAFAAAAQAMAAPMMPVVTMVTIVFIVRSLGRGIGDTGWCAYTLVSRPGASVTDLSAPVAEGVHEPAAERRIELVEGDIADGVYGAAELLQVARTAVALEQVRVEPCPVVQLQRAVKVGSDELDEFVAVHRFDTHVASLR